MHVVTVMQHIAGRASPLPPSYQYPPYPQPAYPAGYNIAQHGHNWPQGILLNSLVELAISMWYTCTRVGGPPYYNLPQGYHQSVPYNPATHPISIEDDQGKVYT